MPIRLPQDPTESNYEDLITACLTGLGFFTEACLHLRKDSTEVFELDVVATPVNETLDGVLLVDAKSGKTGTSDLFKLFGLRTFLDIPKACIIRAKPPAREKLTTLRELAASTNVHVATINLDDIDLDQLPGASIHLPEAIRDDLITAAWYGRIGKRLCMAEFNALRPDPAEPMIAEVKRYRWAVEQGFFKQTPLSRAKAVYDAFQASPNITDRFIRSRHPENLQAIWNAVRDNAAHLDFQFTLMIEHTARLRIVKNALIHILQRQHNDNANADQILRDFRGWNLPAAFRRGVLELIEHPYRQHIPFLWQLFVEVFGGFYSLANDADLEMLSLCTEVPQEDIVGCLELYDTFFPTPNRWFYTSRELKVLKNVPTVYHGTGAFLRDHFYGDNAYADHAPNMYWLIRNWNNALITILEPELGFQE